MIKLVGGYKIISLRTTDFAVGTRVKIPGIYNLIESNAGKAILVKDYSIDGVEQLPFFSAATTVGTTYYMFRLATQGSVQRFVIDESDFVTFRQDSYDIRQPNDPGGDDPSASM